MKGLLAILGKPAPKGEDASSSEMEEEAPESGQSEAAEYKSILEDSAKAGDWGAFADAVQGLVRCSK